jgi:two-component system chemotaxis response regulator CheB
MINVLIVDDSATVRQTMKQVLGTAKDLALDTALDPIFALEKMRKRWPDVIVLDLEMPRMDGLAFLRKVMAERPTPIIVCSTLTQAGAATSIEALAAGAVAVFPKSELNVDTHLEGLTFELVRAVRTAAISKLWLVAPRSSSSSPKLTADAMLPAGGPAPMQVTTERLVAIGTSTGGTQALEAILPRLPRTCPGLVIVQHMPAAFTTAFAERLDGLCEIDVREARSGDRVLPGLALIAPGGRHLLAVRQGAQYAVEVREGPPVNRHCPSVDVLFRSVARAAGRNASGLILTGMGDDGARGLLEMREAGAITWAQDEASCVVFGMPKEAIALGAAMNIVPLDEVPHVIARAARRAAA